MPKSKSLSDEHIGKLVHELHEDEEWDEDNGDSNRSLDDGEIHCLLVYIQHHQMMKMLQKEHR